MTRFGTFVFVCFCLRLCHLLKYAHTLRQLFLIIWPHLLPHFITPHYLHLWGSCWCLNSFLRPSPGRIWLEWHRPITPTKLVTFHFSPQICLPAKPADCVRQICHTYCSRGIAVTCAADWRSRPENTTSLTHLGILCHFTSWQRRMVKSNQIDRVIGWKSGRVVKHKICILRWDKIKGFVSKYKDW